MTPPTPARPSLKLMFLVGLMWLTSACGVPVDKYSDRVKAVVANCHEYGGSPVVRYVFGGVNVECYTVIEP